MDLILHFVGLAFIPLLGYILYLGGRDIWIIIKEEFPPAPFYKPATKSFSKPQRLYRITA